MKVRAAGDQAGGEPPKISLRVDGKEAKVVEVSVPRRDPKVYEEKIALAAGKRRISAAFINDFYNAEAPRARDRDRNRAASATTRRKVQSPRGGEIQRFDRTDAAHQTQ